MPLLLLPRMLIGNWQNLLPLVLRPLRLVVSAEHLRTIRIVLLKATHWPFVALILGFENGRLYWRSRREMKPFNMSTMHGSDTQVSLRRSAVCRTPLQKPLLDAGPKPFQLAKQARDARSHGLRPSNDDPAAVETQEALRLAINNLRSQVDALSNLVAQQEHERQYR